MNGPSIRLVVVLLQLIASGVLIFDARVAAAQPYPVRPIRLVTAEAGGGNDVQARLIAQGLSMRMGQRVVVDNRPSGVIPGEIVSKAAPDGYTVLLYNNTFWIGTLMQKTPYDVTKDFSAVVWVSSTPNVLVVNSAVPVKSVAELIALAKANPGDLNYASSGNGASNHLAGELFKAMAAVKIVRIAYKGAAQGLQRSDRRPRAADVPDFSLCNGFPEVRTSEGARRDERRAVYPDTRIADDCCSGLTGLRIDRHIRRVCSGGDAAACRTEAQQRNRSCAQRARSQGEVFKCRHGAHWRLTGSACSHDQIRYDQNGEGDQGRRHTR
jgi:hypothetical protein